MFITFKLKRLIISIIVILAVVVALLLLVRACSDSSAETAALITYGKNTGKLVVDPGHGGIDGGAVSETGLKESDINLAIADKMCGIADFLGIEYLMTRDSDTTAGESDSYSEHDNLVARAELVNATDNAVLISVHQNEYPSAVVRGAEVMYADTDGSKSLAESMQDLLCQQLDPENRRVSRPAPKELLLTRSIDCPGVLVECGFLSNPQEAEMLGNTVYQTKIATILIAAYLNFADIYYSL